MTGWGGSRGFFARFADPQSGSILELVARKEKRVYSHATNTPPEHFYTRDLAWDREATHLDDRASFLPIEQFEEQAAAGRIASLSPHFYGVPTEYSQRRTQEIDAPALLAQLREDAVDVALLVPL